MRSKTNAFGTSLVIYEFRHEFYEVKTLKEFCERETKRKSSELC